MIVPFHYTVLQLNQQVASHLYFVDLRLMIVGRPRPTSTPYLHQHDDQPV